MWRVFHLLLKENPKSKLCRTVLLVNILERTDEKYDFTKTHNKNLTSTLILGLFPGELKFSSVQQDPRAPADHCHCTLVFEPVEGALTFCPDKVPTSMVCWLRPASFYLLCRLVLSYGELLHLFYSPWPIRMQHNLDFSILPRKKNPPLVMVLPPLFTMWKYQV